MTTYFKKLNESGEVILLLTYDFTPKITNTMIVEITQEEYERLSVEIKAANQLEEPDPDEISDAEALDIILGVSE